LVYGEARLAAEFAEHGIAPDYVGVYKAPYGDSLLLCTEHFETCLERFLLGKSPPSESHKLGVFQKIITQAFLLLERLGKLNYFWFDAKPSNIVHQAEGRDGVRVALIDSDPSFFVKGLSPDDAELFSALNPFLFFVHTFYILGIYYTYSVSKARATALQDCLCRAYYKYSTLDKKQSETLCWGYANLVYLVANKQQSVTHYNPINTLHEYCLRKKKRSLQQIEEAFSQTESADKQQCAVVQEADRQIRELFNGTNLFPSIK
jgi:hypothetical protein